MPNGNFVSFHHAEREICDIQLKGFHIVTNVVLGDVSYYDRGTKAADKEKRVKEMELVQKEYENRMSDAKLLKTVNLIGNKWRARKRNALGNLLEK